MSLMKFLIIFYIKLMASLGYSTSSEMGIGSRYGESGDIYAQQPLACNTGRHVDNDLHICAHRWLPCGTFIVIENQSNNELSWCTIQDRGPYGAWIKNSNDEVEWTIKTSPAEPGTWRGILDMSPAVVKEMRHNGFELIKYWIIIGPNHNISTALSYI